MNLEKLAKLAGCSLSTVSKAFNDSPEISAKTKNRIFELAKEYNCFTKYYTPKLHKKIFALICPEISSPFYSAIVEAIEKNVTQNGDILLIALNRFIHSTTEELIDYFINFHHIDGLFLCFSAPNDTKILQKVPTVLIESFSKPTHEVSYFCDFVNSDSSDAIYRIVSYLKEMGHSKIGFIGEYYTNSTLKKFEEALSYYKIPVNRDWFVTSSERKGSAGFDGMDKIISSPSRPTAVMAAYDSIAFGAINRIHAAGLKVPDDISVIGNNDIPLARFSSPPLTTISIPIQEIADNAVELIYERIRSANSMPYKKVFLQSKLTIRESVKNMKE